MSSKNPLIDRFQRTISYARIAVTSRCNLRCTYCMSEEHECHSSASHRDTLKTADIALLIRILAGLGIRKIRFTGGEPLLRNDIAELVRTAKDTVGIETVSLTTNGVLLHKHLDGLRKAGLDALNLSIDTLDRERYRAITRRDVFEQVKANLDILLASKAIPVKLNVVMMRGINSDEIAEFMEFTREHAVTVRFMELQPFDDHQIWKTGRFLGLDKIQALLREIYPELLQHRGTSTEYFSFSLSGYEGSAAIIPAYTRNFCSQCNRIRITSEGTVISCLYDKQGIELLPLLQRNAEIEEISDLFRTAVHQKPEDGRNQGEGENLRTSMSEIGG
ncbi:GTP 3',8-cyclase MoaA [Chlorobium limicola]|uniref:GTP 3',8-cyclase n=1 Tax=Chlorobium limicola TaxID=1092 RepID=A0A117MSH2_CHLLI|nr:GTP 3',8-cyclase MoaA [Chlorobium limicola]KUL33277.1 cyclic pyranopterin phosphate synthase MoaA [Chlorobium limicola]